jgi:hypothetical protein
MNRLALAFVRRVCDPAKLEALEGDLIERSRAGWLAWADALSIALYHSRLTTPRARRRLSRFALVAGVVVVFALGLDPTRARTTPVRYLINASDPAGRFTIEIENARVIAATMDEMPVDPARLLQRDATIVIKDGNRGRDFEITLNPRGGISWAARTP